jgi:predicted RNase H-like nuclease (RuvC/YqgF family)
MALSKCIVRYAVIAGLVGGTAALVAGPDRLSALFSQAQGNINAAIDSQIDDPIALRQQMKSLAGEYPERIADVKADLAELRQQTGQLQREREVSERVVSLAEADFEQIKGLIERGETALAQSEGHAQHAQTVRVVFNNEPLDLKDAYARAGRIQQVHGAYATRVADIDRDMGYLQQQEQRLTALLGQLETEHTEFQTQMWALDRQVDQISRNDRLIELMEKRQTTIEDNSRYSASSLDQIAGRFADIRARQEAKLETLGTSTSTSNYEDRAKFDLDTRKAWDGVSLAPGEGSTEAGPRGLSTLPTINRGIQLELRSINTSRPGVIEIRPEASDRASDRAGDRAGDRTPDTTRPLLPRSAEPDAPAATRSPASLKPVAPIQPIAMKPA